MSLMLINPRKRKGGRTAAQKAATRRMLAANRARRGASPKRRSKRRSNPIGLSRVSRAVKRVTRRSKRRSNPSMRSMTGGMGAMLMDSLKGAGGAVVVNAVTNYLPAKVTTGKMVYVTRAAIALVLGTFGKKLLGNSARIMAEGALVVNFHDAINSVAGTMLPGSALHGVDGMGEYITAQGMLPQATHGTRSFDSELNQMGEYMHA